MGTTSQPAARELPSDWTFDRLSLRAQFRLVSEAVAQELQSLRRRNQQPSYWQRLQLKQAIDLIDQGFFGSSLTKLRLAREPAPPDLPQVEREARRWTLSFLEHAYAAAIEHPRRRPRGL